MDSTIPPQDSLPDTSPRKKKKTRRSQKKPGQRPEKTKRWLDYNRAKIGEHSVDFTVDHHPWHFVSIKKDQQKVRENIQAMYPDVEPRDLPKAWEDDNTTVTFSLTQEMNDADEAAGLVTPPLALLRRYDSVIDLEVCNDVVTLWDQFMATKPTHTRDKTDNRSATLAFHLGVWQFTNARPKVTQESWDQKPRTIIAMDALLLYLKQHVLPKINNLLRHDFPDQWTRALKVRARLLRNTSIAKKFRDRPALDLGPAVCSVALKEGSSENIHLDFSDDPAYFAWLFVVGDFTGGDFCSPQLGKRFPIRPGQIFAVRARYVVHCSSPHEGRRIVMTGFMDVKLLHKAARDILQRDGIVQIA